MSYSFRVKLMSKQDRDLSKRQASQGDTVSLTERSKKTNRVTAIAGDGSKMVLSDYSASEFKVGKSATAINGVAVSKVGAAS